MGQPPLSEGESHAKVVWETEVDLTLKELNYAAISQAFLAAP